MSCASKTKKPRTPAEHPSYKDMITAAIKFEKSPKGVSTPKCLHYICSNYKVSANVRTQLRLSIVRQIKSGYLVQTKGKGAAGSFKLSNATKESEKQKEKLQRKKEKAVTKTAKAAPKVKKAAPKAKPAAKKAKATPKKKTAAKKAAATKVVKKAVTKTPKKTKAAKKTKSPSKKASPKKKGAKKGGAKKAKK